jgi:hypothetical protein
MRENGTKDKKVQRRKSSNNSKARGSSPKEILGRKGFLSKGTNPGEMLGQNPKEHVSTTTKWGITPKIAPSPKPKMGTLR